MNATDEETKDDESVRKMCHTFLDRSGREMKKSADKVVVVFLHIFSYFNNFRRHISKDKDTKKAVSNFIAFSQKSNESNF